jgi:catalase
VTLVLCRYREHIEGFEERSRSTKLEEHYSQAQLFYNSLVPYEKAHLVSAFSFELSHCDDPVVYKNMSVRLSKINNGLTWQVALNVGGAIPEPVDANHKQTSAGLSQRDFVPKEAMIVTRRIAILIVDGVNTEEVKWLRRTVQKVKVTAWLVGPRWETVYRAEQTGGTTRSWWQTTTLRECGRRCSTHCSCHWAWRMCRRL